MNTSNPHPGRGRCSREILLAAAASACLLSSASMAAIVTSPVANVPVPQNIDGVYINVVTGATGTSGGSTAGWDLNPYSSSSNLNFFWPASPAGTSGGVATTAGTIPIVLAPGDTIGPASAFSGAGVTQGSNFRATQTAYLGFRFWNEGAGMLNYGYMQISTTAETGFPATVNSIVYDNSGAAITIPNPLPPTAANLRLGFSGPSVPVRGGTSVPVYLRVDNYGPDAAYPPTVYFSASSPPGSTSVTAPAGWSCDGGTATKAPGTPTPAVPVLVGTQYTCYYEGNLARGTSRFTFRITAPANPPGGFVALNASVESDSMDPIPDNNSASFKLYVKPSESLGPVAPPIR